MDTIQIRTGLLLFLGTLLFFFVNVQAVAVPGSIFDELQADLRISAASVTALGSAFMYVYAVNQLVIGLLVDRFGGYRVIAVGALLFCIGAALFPFSDSLFMLYFSRAVIGFGASSIYLSLVKEYSRTFSENFAPMLGLMILIGYTGGIMASAPFIAGVNVIGWRMMLKIIAALILLVSVLFLFMRFTVKMPEKQNVSFGFKPFWNICRNRHNRHLFMLSAVAFGIYYVLQTVIGKKFLEDFAGMSSVRSAWMLSLLGVLSALTSLISPVISRLCGNRRRIFMLFCGIGILISCMAIVLMLAVNLRSPLLATVLLCTVTVAANVIPLQVALLRETNSYEVMGVGVSFMNFCAYLAVAVLGNAVGLLMDIFPPERIDARMLYGRNSYLAVFTILLAFACFGAYSSTRLRETMGNFVPERDTGKKI